MAKKGFKITIHGVADYHAGGASKLLATIVAEKMENFLEELQEALNPEDEKVEINASSIYNVQILGHGNDEYPEVLK
jgi:hypothetical protein